MKKIKIYHCMIFVAIVAICIWIDRYHELMMTTSHFALMVRIAPAAVVMTIAFVIVKMRTSKDRTREMFRSSGMSACSIVLFFLLALPAFRLIRMMQHDGEYLNAGVDYWMPIAFFTSIPIAGYALVAAWGNMIICGTLCFEKNWSDRVGRALGIYWIITGLIIDFD